MNGGLWRRECDGMGKGDSDGDKNRRLPKLRKKKSPAKVLNSKQSVRRRVQAALGVGRGRGGWGMIC